MKSFSPLPDHGSAQGSQPQPRSHNEFQRQERSGGRQPLGGRSLVNVGGRSSPPQRNPQLPGGGRINNANRSYNNGRSQQNYRGGPPGRGPQPISIHQNSGIPFGHVPAYLPGSASLVEQLDQRILIVLRDGRHLIGTLASFDQFSNLVLLDAIERRIVTVQSDSQFQYYYSDVPLGIYVVRGESMVLAGDVQDNLEIMENVSLEKLAEYSKVSLKGLDWDFDADLTA